MTLALSRYKISTDDKNDVYFLFSSPFIILFKPIGDATIISEESKLEK